MSEKSASISPALFTAAANLRIDHSTAQVLTAFEAAHVECLLLKGPSIARWLYPGAGMRAYSDQDLLVAPASRTAATAVLTELGFIPDVEEHEMPSWWREHAVTWMHREAPMVDLHHTLVGVGVDDQMLWSVLSADADQLVVGAVTARVLSTSARALHLALHAAQHGGGVGLRDLERALEVLDDSTWREAAELARRLQAVEAFAAGLSLVPAGTVMASSLDLPTDWSVTVELKASLARAEAQTVEHFVRASGPRARIAILRHKLFPPATFMRHWSPQARRGRLGLSLSYVHRVAWVARRSGPALSAWRAARRGRRGGATPPT